MIERFEHEKPATLEELTEEERRDLENLRRVKRGEALKILCRDYVIYNGEWYREKRRDWKYRWDWPNDIVPTARLMTLEEYKARAEMPQDERDPVWEEWTGLAHRFDKWRGMKSGWAIPNTGYEGYGKSWRCWTSRPTDEQRRATPWK